MNLSSIEKVVVAVIFGLLSLFVFSVYLQVKQLPEQYSAWSKVHPETHLTFDEWRSLNNAHQLPGQTDMHIDPVAVFHN